MYREPEMGMARVDGKGRVLIPKNVRRRAGLSEHTVLLVGSDNMVFLKKADIRELHVLDDMGGLMLTSVCPSRQSLSVRDLAIWSLANRGAMTSRKLYNLVRSSGTTVSYQYVWKTLQDLVKKGQIRKVAWNRYAIDPQWIRQLKCMCDIVEQRYQALGMKERVRE